MSNIGHIYKLTCSETKRVYIGSTTRTLQERLWKHRSKTNGCVSRDFINPTIELIESIEYDDYDKLLWRERFHVETEDCVNNDLPIITKEEKRLRKNEAVKRWRKNNPVNKEEKKEYMRLYNIKNKKVLNEKCKLWYQSHKEEALKYKREWNLKNADHVKEQKRKKFNCECGGKYQHSTRARHFKTERHQAFIGSKLESK